MQQSRLKSSSGLLVSYVEMFKLLGELASVANILKDPRGMVERRQAEKAGDDEFPTKQSHVGP